MLSSGTLRLFVRGTFAAALVGLALAGCNEPWNSSSSSANYTIGGSVSGLQAGATVVLGVGSETLNVTSNGAFAFSASFSSGTAYLVTIVSPPAGEQCVVDNAGGTIASADVTDVTVSCSVAVADSWTWFAGSSTATSEPGTYGTKAVPSTGAIPGARFLAATWTDTAGNFWLFGGFGYDADGLVSSYLNDLWRYERGAQSWTWITGSDQVDASSAYGTIRVASSSATPGARAHAATWRDASGNLWLFGGYGHDTNGTLGYLADLWQFSVSTQSWTWMGGPDVANSGAGVYGTQGTGSATNQPGARVDASAWTDAQGRLWMFGGTGYDVDGNVGYLDDLWLYAPSTGHWTWMGGSNTSGATAGVYGTQGTAAQGNFPGARSSAAAWVDSSGNLWLFGGTGYDSVGTLGPLNDLWKFVPSGGAWAWISGAKTASASGAYGVKGTAASGNQPGARSGAAAAADASGNLWLMGGAGLDAGGTLGLLNDLWMFSPASGTWTWMSGSSQAGAILGIYGTQGVSATSNTPGAREGAAMWGDPSGNLWIFGGSGYNSNALPGALNDLWEFTP